MRKLALIFIGLFSFVYAQNSFLMGTHRIVTEGCGAYIYDNGGTSGIYGNGRNDTITIYSNDDTNPKVQLIFNTFDILSGDTLFIYDSNVANPTKIVSLGTYNQPWLNNSNPITTGITVFTASSTNTSGAITLRFKSNATGQGDGFKITTLCTGGCQQVIATINASASTPPLVLQSSQLYSNFCPYQSLSISAQGTYPENTLTYNQSDNTSLFIWTYNDTATYSGIGMNIFTPTFSIQRASEIKLTIKDNHNCVSTNNAMVRVRPSRNPIFSSPSEIITCVGDSVIVTTGPISPAQIILNPVFTSGQSSFSNDTLLFIPDGPNCTGLDQCLNKSITINSASPGQTIQSITDIQSVVVKIEHSYIGDLEIKLVCPNQQFTNLHAFSNGGGLFLGNPIDDQGGCTPIPQLAGQGWNYAWSENTTLGYAYHATAPNYLFLAQSTQSCDSTNLANKTNYYKPMQSFSSLIGCPINGNWSLQICDHYGIDDGWLFNFSLNLNPELVTSTSWGYSVPINEVLWSGPYINSYTDSTVLIIPPVAGTFQYTYVVVDDFGCAYDSSFLVTAIGNTVEILYDYPLLISNIVNGNHWYIETIDGIFSIPGATNQTYEPYETATYFTVISENNCAADTSNKIFVDLSNNINATSNLTFKIIPNPSKGVFQIRLANTPENSSLNVLSIDGKIILSQTISEKISTVNISHLSKGIYLIQLNSSKGRITKKLIIE